MEVYRRKEKTYSNRFYSCYIGVLGFTLMRIYLRGHYYDPLLYNNAHYFLFINTFNVVWHLRYKVILINLNTTVITRDKEVWMEYGGRHRGMCSGDET